MAFAPVFQRPFSPTFDRRAAIGNGLLNNLIAYWKMDEASGSALDAHANGLTMTQNASPGSAAGLVYAGARTFNGSSQYFYRTNSSIVQTGNVDFTWSAWVRTGASLPLFAPIMTKGRGSLEYSLYYQASYGYNKFRFEVHDGSNLKTIGASSPSPASVDTWYMVTGWHDSVLDTINIQINDGTVYSTQHSTGVRELMNDLWFGGAEWAEYWLGRIGPVAFWKSAAGGGGVLTAAQRTALWNGGAGLAYAAFTT